MANGSFKKKGSAQGGANPNPKVLVAGWIGSMVLVALVTVLVTYNFSDDGSEADAGAPEQVTQSQPDRDVVESSADTQIESSEATDDAQVAANEPAPEPEQPQFMPDLQLIGRQGIVPLAGANMPPSDVVAGWCRDLAARVDGVDTSDCMSGAFADSGHKSVNGRALVMRKIEPSKQQAGSGRVLLIAATHGDELSSVGTVFSWMNIMADKGTPYAWQVAPVLNPDGLFHEPPTRVNANGVDLNRNLPTAGWDKESRDYWRRVGFEKRRFPGESAGSEPENKWLAEQIREFKPDVIISLHAPYGLLDYDGDFPAPRKMGSLNLHRLGVYPGSLGNYASRMQGIPVITVELDNADEAPGEQEIAQMFTDLNAWLDRYFRSVRQASAGNGAAEAG
ncbi:M14 family zinc carboxypeptidase [Salinisphaera sp.]|uniref:M14 family zinc carboxypeptidase n=1 Tax=Salinisphaera sp. TaxID=1914330 RepID=UPI000C6304FB|nr:M14 family zinc carboxypeptidase [Salinisphaera sp.]MBS62024.1 hypothetical protein [Salinisphaera sp.]